MLGRTNIPLPRAYVNRPGPGTRPAPAGGGEPAGAGSSAADERPFVAFTNPVPDNNLDIHATGRAGLPTLTLAHPSGASAEVYLHGAHVASWIPAGGEEALFLSRAAHFGGASAIRGGVPVIFPQFAQQGALPKHGFARNRRWELVGEPGPGTATLRLRDDAETRALWPHAFQLELTVELQADSLRMAMRVENTGDDLFAFTAALHTYLRVGEVEQAVLQGLGGATYRSTVEGVDGAAQPAPELRISGEVDRIYFDAPRHLVLRDPSLGRVIQIQGDGFSDVVVWNPWADLAATLPDMQPAEYREMLCVEAAEVGRPVALSPGEAWKAAQRLTHQRAP